MVASGESASMPNTAHTMPALIRPTTAPAKNATGPYHQGQRGRASSGSSGG